eukprot:2216198-Amphidinium_carterae.1
MPTECRNGQACLPKTSYETFPILLFRVEAENAINPGIAHSVSIRTSKLHQNCNFNSCEDQRKAAQ